MAYKMVYLIGTGSYLPGGPVGNEDIDKYIQPINTRSAKLKNMILKENGIETRYYGINPEGQTQLSLVQMASRSVTKSLEDANVGLDEIEMIATGTCGGDLIVPGFANMVQGELKAQPMETSTHIGICASGIAALRHASDAIELGRIKKASVSGCEFPSRLFKTSRFVEGYDVDFDSHFLRWMLSDGSGSMVLSSTPSPSKVSLKVSNIHLKSFSGDYATCMYIGSPISDHSKSCYDYPTMADAEKQGSYLLRQNIRMLPQLFEVCLFEYAALIKKGEINPNEVDHFIVHYSSQKFEGVMQGLLEKMNLMIPKDRWYSNLKTRGNMGSASIFVMIDDFLKEREVKVGQKILCFIPESGRFSVGFVQFEVVGPDASLGQVTASDTEKTSMTNEEFITKSIAPVEASDEYSLKLRNLLLNLADVWHGYRSRVWRTKYFSKITRNQLLTEDYIKWIENWIPQVRQGSKWMRTAVSNMQDPFVDLKALIETHASEEQNDWKILFQDYQNAGGKVQFADELNFNAGGKALNDFMYSRANSVNAVDLLGGIYIIEGTGQRIIPVMLPLVRSQLSLGNDCFKFLQYHGANDEHHIHRWLIAVEIVLESDHDGSLARRMVETADRVADLYCRQMEEVFE